MIARNRIRTVLTLAAVAMAVFAGPAQAGPDGELGILTPGTLAGNNPATGVPWANGDTYRFAFITSATSTTESTDISTYNAFVQGLADATTAYNIGVDEGVTWKVIGSTAEVDAIDNTSTTWTDESPGSPIFLLDGSTLIASDYKDLWDGEIQHIINITEEGVEFSHWPFTGTNLDGTAASSEFGSFGSPVNGSVTQGNGGSTTEWIWRTWTGKPTTDELYMYALSDPLVILAEPGQAFGPNPADGHPEVLRDSDLSWSPGIFAVQHNVYVGTSFEGVNTATVPTISGLDANSLDPGRLTLGTTYYWRVDELNEAPDDTVFKGDVWSFTVEPAAIPLDNELVTVSATSMSDPNEDPNNVINGSGLAEVEGKLGHSDLMTDMWLSTDADPNAAITFVLDRVYKLHQIHVWNHNSGNESIAGFGMKDALVEYSVDGETWMELGVVTIPQATGEPNDLGADVDLGGIVAQQVRLTTVANHSTYGLPQVGLAEVQFMVIPTLAREPQPADGDLLDGVEVELAWRAGREAVSHDIYLGTDGNDLAFVDTSTEASYVIPVNYGTTYYWSITEVNEAEAPAAYAGPVWSFTTPAYGIVDDFESYNDIDPPDQDSHTIFEGWPDGFEISENGALVGYDPAQPSYAETVIVHGGDQSMPMLYSNTLGATYSEGTHTFADPQDWTASGIKTLALAFHGTLGNTGILYVKINNTKVTYDLDAAHIAIAQWQAWNIDLSSLVNASLQSVTDLIIGVEGDGAIGTLYIDDIRVYPKAGELTTPVDPGAENLVAAWNFDEGSGTVATDSSGNGLNGTIVDAAWDTGKQGSALLFNGVSSYVNIDGFKGINADRTDPNNPIQQAFTIAKWIKTSVGEGSMLTWGTNAGRQRLGWRLNGNTLRIEHQAGALRGNTPVNDDEWHHVALVVSEGANLRTPATLLYLDGRPDSTFQGSDNPFELTANVDARIGMSAPRGDRFFTGLIDEVVIYDRALTGEELLWLADRTTPIHKPL